MTTHDVIKQDFLSALARLLEGCPTHQDLIEKANEGKLSISPATVAKEARRSRTLIGMETCKYPDVRREILASKDESPLQTKRSKAVQAMASQVRALKKAIQIKDSALAVAMSKIDALERRLRAHEPIDPKISPIKGRTK